MKDSWVLYNYLRRWWRLLLLLPALGALLGLGYANNQAHPATYDSTATGVIGESLPDHVGSPPKVDFPLFSGSQLTAETALEELDLMLGRLATYAISYVVLQDVKINRNSAVSWWKPIVFGGVVGGLLAVAGIYVWADIRAYQLYRGQVESRI